MLPASYPTYETYRPLQQAFDVYNALLFDNELPQCLISIQREKRTCGFYTYQRYQNEAGDKCDSIELNPSFFATLPIIEVMQILVHIMTHHWQHHFGKPGRGGHYHNRQLANKLISIGLMPSDTGKPGGKITGQKMSDYPIEGGLFLQASESLLSSDFKLSWYDRFPPPRAYGAGSLSYALTIDLSKEAKEIPADTFIDVEEPEEPDKKTNRSTYICKCKRSSVTGKKGLNITCNICKTVFVDSKKTDNPPA
jgi:hypothetical protein